jgi:hypothetical protein
MTTFLGLIFHSMVAGDGLKAESYNQMREVVVASDPFRVPFQASVDTRKDFFYF